jgi:hypothetical protein
MIQKTKTNEKKTDWCKKKKKQLWVERWHCKRMLKSKLKRFALDLKFQNYSLRKRTNIIRKTKTNRKKIHWCDKMTKQKEKTVVG